MVKMLSAKPVFRLLFIFYIGFFWGGGESGTVAHLRVVRHLVVTGALYMDMVMLRVQEGNCRSMI